MAATFSYRQAGDTLTLTAPYDRLAGEGALVGSIFGVALANVLSGADGPFSTCGVHELAKTSAQAWVQGEDIHWNLGTKLADSNPLVGPRIGVATEDAANPSATGFVKLDESGAAGAGSSAASAVQALRVRATIAQVNAGLELLPALAGKSYRLVDAGAIAVGGAVGATTTVDLLGDLGGSRKLVAWAQASLTQSTLLRAGGAGAAILADGASFTANDANTAIRVGKTGADLTTATHVDFQVLYTVE